MRRMDTPIASRWAHIALRDALLAKVTAPRDVHPVDWVAERAWLLLRMGEADAARMLIAGVDTDRFTPKMQAAVQSATGRAAILRPCARSRPIGKYEPNIRALVWPCARPSRGAGDRFRADRRCRRRGRIGGIDLALAQKVVGAARWPRRDHRMGTG